MTLPDHESLSAMLDHEADDLELRRLCKALENGTLEASEIAELEARWKRFNLAQMIIHGDFTGSDIPSLSKEFNLGVMSAIESETGASSSAIAASVESSLDESSSAVVLISNWKQNAIKLAVAASVAAIAVVVLQAPSQQGVMVPANGLMASETVSTAAPANTSYQTVLEMPQGTEAVRQVADIDPEARQRLLDYIDSMSLNDDDEPIGFQRLEDSPLLRLVNEIELDN